MRRSGFTLVEVVVALLIFQVGLLGVVGTLVLASRTVGRAVRLEGAVAEVESVLDSLSHVAGRGPGIRQTPGGTLTWSLDADGEVSLTFRGDTGWPRVDVWSHLPGDGAP